MQETEYEDDVDQMLFDDPPLYSLNLVLPESRGEVQMVISQKLQTSHLIQKLSFILGVAKSRIILETTYYELTDSPLSRLNCIISFNSFSSLSENICQIKTRIVVPGREAETLAGQLARAF